MLMMWYCILKREKWFTHKHDFLWPWKYTVKQILKLLPQCLSILHAHVYNFIYWNVAIYVAYRQFKRWIKWVFKCSESNNICKLACFLDNTSYLVLFSEKKKGAIDRYISLHGVYTVLSLLWFSPYTLILYCLLFSLHVFTCYLTWSSQKCAPLAGI